MKLISVILSLWGINFVSSKSYERFKVYSIYHVTSSDVEKFYYWEHNPFVDFWSHPSVNKSNSVMVAPPMQTKFEEFLTYENFNYEVLIENVGKTIKSPTKSKSKFHFLNGNFTDTVARDFSHYWSLPEIEHYIEFLAQSTDLHVKRLIIGQSYEGRNIYALTISLDETVGNQPILFIDAGIHAREWAGHMSVLFLLHQLAENFSANLELLRNVDWVIVPVVNPDGYVYTFTKDRFWRKNRRRIDENCVGVDINRNFGFGWKPAADGTSACSLTNPGPAANSEPETKALAGLMRQFKNKLKLYVSMHSFASFLMYPFSFDYVHISNWKQHRELCKLYCDTVNRITRFEPFTFGHSASEFYPATGVSDDHVIGEAGAEMSIVIELPSGGRKGFDFPEEDIKDLVKETFVGLREIAIYVGMNFYN